MKNEMMLFNYEENTVRTLKQGEETWFVGKDICDILGYSNPRDAIATHVDEEDKNTVAIHDGSQRRNMTLTNCLGGRKHVRINSI